MASFLPSCAIITPSFKHYTRQPMRVRAQSRRDGGRSSNRVDDTNLRVLRERIEQLKVKEKLERCCRCEYGWNYASGYNCIHNKVRRDWEISEFLELVRLVGATIGFTCLSGTLFLCLVSIFVHLSQ